jgi:acyl transferase domain-containing protein
MEKVIGSKTAVYIASFTHEFAGVIGRDPELLAKWIGTGNGPAMLSNRLSYFFDLLGPSITLDTACSGSMNAFHLACNTLRNREATMARNTQVVWRT